METESNTSQSDWLTKASSKRQWTEVYKGMAYRSSTNGNALRAEPADGPDRIVSLGSLDGFSSVQPIADAIQTASRTPILSRYTEVFSSFGHSGKEHRHTMLFAQTDWGEFYTKCILDFLRRDRANNSVGDVLNCDGFYLFSLRNKVLDRVTYVVAQPIRRFGE